MATANVGTVMAGLATRCATISGLRVTQGEPDSVTPPVAIVGLPEVIEYDSTMQRGSDRLEIPVHVLVGRVSDRTAVTRIAAYLSGGAGGIKTAIEADKTLSGSAQTARVISAELSTYAVAGQEYLGAAFTIEILT